MAELKQKLARYFKNLNTKQKLLWVSALLIILVCFYLIFIKNNYRESEINYNDVNAQKIIEYSSEVYNREELLSINDIVSNILKIYDETWILDNKAVTLKTLYSEATTKNYQKGTSKRKFVEKMNNIYSKVFSEEDKFNSNKNYIDKVYYSDTYDMYLIKLLSINDSEAYIGIKIDDGSYLIKYAE